MKSFSGVQRLRGQFKILAIFLIGTFLLPITAQAELTLGRYTFAYSSAQHLNNPMHLSRGLKSFGFVSGVGGVAFGGVAEPEDGLTVATLSYNEKQPDGNRLKVTLVTADQQQKTVIAPVPDWIMIPIARFADQDQHAIFTLFGKLNDQQLQQQYQEKDTRILNYHPAVSDTLLGLRLFQADILAFHPASFELPTMDGRVLLGTGEVLPNISANKTAQEEISTMYENGEPRSYVICDHDQRITFALSKLTEGRLELNGYPYWACWKLNKEMDEIFLDYVRNYLESNKDNLFVEVQAAAMQKAAEGIDITEAVVEKLFMEVRDRAVETAVTDMDSYNNFVDNNEYFIQMTDFSRQFSQKMRQMEGGNPSVYQALTTAMRYAAFFRHVKKQRPNQFQAFLTSLNSVVLRPVVQTPTVFIGPDETVAVPRL